MNISQKKDGYLSLGHSTNPVWQLWPASLEMQTSWRIWEDVVKYAWCSDLQLVILMYSPRKAAAHLAAILAGLQAALGEALPASPKGFLAHVLLCINS